MPQYSKIDDGGLWDILTIHQGEQFATCGRGSLPGKPFTYTIKGGEMFISTKEKSITKASVVMAYQKAVALQQQEGCVTGPKRIGTFGASYLYPIFLRLGFITRTPLTLLMESGKIDADIDEGTDTMPRPKGSKNKKTVTVEIVETVESIYERIAEAEKAIEILSADLKAKKAELKELTKLKEQAEAAAAAKKAEEDKAKLLEAVAASGKSVDEIIELLKQ